VFAASALLARWKFLFNKVTNSVHLKATRAGLHLRSFTLHLHDIFLFNRVWCRREASGEVYAGGYVENERHGIGVRTSTDGSVGTVKYYLGALIFELAQVCGCNVVPHIINVAQQF
jgi:hypothetical protein